MIETIGADSPDIEQRLQRYRRPLYAVILCLIAIDALVAQRLLDTPFEAVARYVLASGAAVGALLLWAAPRLFRAVEVGVFVLGSVLSLTFLGLALGGQATVHAEAVRSFTVWLALLVVWAFLTFGSRAALGSSALLLGLGVAQVLVHIGATPPPDDHGVEFGALADLLLVGSAYLMLLFALTNSIERRSAALASEETAARMLALDSLTGVTNRAAFHRLHQKITRGRGDAPFTLMLVDLDDFRSINERFGTAVGDDVLREVALRLANTVGQEARVLARLGGDVFGFLLDGPLEDEQAGGLSARVARAFQAPFTAGGGPLQVTATVGISRYPQDAQTPTEQVSQAERAVVRAREVGEKYRIASRDDHEVEREALERDLREALGKGELELYYQPIGTVVGAGGQERDGAKVTVRTVEALLRWNHPERGIVPPADFIPIAERAGLIVSIGNWVLGEACRQAMRWEREGVGAFNVSVNVSPHQFTDPGLTESVRRALHSTGLPPGRLLVEVTETSADQPVVEQRLAEIRALGVRVAIDDFGAGYSSLGRLRNMPIDLVKLDRSFVRGLEGDDMRVRLIVRAAVVLAHGLGAKVVAEGIESEPQAAAAVDIGCDYLQGYLIDPPASARRFAAAWTSGDVRAWLPPEDAEGVTPAARLN